MKKLLIISVSLILLLIVSCKQEKIGPNLFDDNKTDSIGAFEIKTITATTRNITVKWTSAKNAVKYDVLVNDTIGLSDAKNDSCTLNYLKPNTEYKISIKAYDKNNYTKTITVFTKTLIELLNEITSLPLQNNEYQRLNITHCKVTKDNNYIILGDVYINDIAYKIVMKTDKNFKIIWKYNYEGGVFDYMNRATRQNIKECNDGGFLIIAREFIFKISKDGNVLFQKKYSIQNYEPWIDNGTETTNGNFLFVGTNHMMLDSNCDTLWIKKKDLNEIIDVIQNDANNYFILGSNKANEKYSVVLQELDNSGNKLKENSFNISDNCYSQYFLKSIDNGYYLISSSFVYYYGNTQEMCVSKINSSGNEIWTLHSLPNLDLAVTAYDARVLYDNTLLCLCYSFFHKCYYIYEISPEGRLTKSFIVGGMNGPVFVDKDQSGRYVILTREGIIYKLIN